MTGRRELAARILPFVGLAVMVLAVYALNRWCVPYSDDLAYALEGENTPLEGAVRHATDFSDILRMQVNDYVKGPNGRVLVHTVVAAFCTFGLQGLFDVVNTGMWFLLVWLVLREGGVCGHFLSGAALVFVFLWQAETCSSSVAFAVNYLWTACLTVLMMDLWRGRDAWWMVPVCFLFGWSQEAFSLPMVAGLGACCVLQSFARGRLAWTGWRCAAYVALVLGALGCIGGHFLSGREMSPESRWLLALIVLPFWPAVLIGCIAALVWYNRRRIPALVADDLEWWMFFLAAAAMFGLIGRQGLRLAMPMLLSGLILCLRNRRFFVRLRGTIPVVVVIALVWMTVGAWIQRRLAVSHAEMVETYLKNPQGLTYRRAVATGPFDGTVCTFRHAHWSLGLLRQYYGHPNPPIVLSPSLYEEVMRPSAGDRTLQAVTSGRTGLKRFLPGRLGRMFPDEDYHSCLPTPETRVTDPSGHTVVLQEVIR